MKRDQVRDVLHSRTYLGEVKSRSGEWIPAKHPPMIDAATFVRAQEALAARRLGGARPRSAPAETDTWWLRDVAVCGKCGARMGAAYAGPKDARRYYFRCSHKCGAPYVPVHAAEVAAAPLVLARLAELRAELARAPKQAAPPPATLDQAAGRRRLEGKRARYLEMYADGVMAKEAMVAAVGKVDADLLKLRAKPAPSALSKPEARREALAHVSEIERAWSNSGPERRRAIVGALAAAMALVAGAAAAPRWRSLEELAAPLVITG